MPLIDASDAHLWWDNHPHEVCVVQFGERPPQALLYDGWASYTKWGRYNDEQRLREMMESAIELMFDGHDPRQVILEFSKVRQFRNLGAESWPMCRVISAAIMGRRDLDPEDFRKEYCCA